MKFDYINGLLFCLGENQNSKCLMIVIFFFSKQAVREFLLQANEIGRNSLLVWGLDLWSDKRKQFEDHTLPLRWGEKQYSYKNNLPGTALIKCGKASN